LFNDEGAGGHRFRIRYFSPRAEVAFCGHATIATAVALAEREGTGNLRLVTSAGEVIEDPATGAAAAAFGAYLRSLKLVTPPVRVTIHQGEDMGRPSRLLVDVPAGDGSGTKVSGTASPLNG
jgi:predicted PhzF superfamily epimerase YddE/YHI9